MKKRVDAIKLASFVSTWVLLLLILPAVPAFAGTLTYGAATTSSGPIYADGSAQTVATYAVTNNQGGINVSTITVTLSGSVSSGNVTQVVVTNGTNTWSASGSYGSGSAVVCSGTAAKPGNISVNVYLAAGAAGKNVGISITADSSGTSTDLPQASGLVSISAPPAGNSYGTMSSLPGPLVADLTQQTVATVPVTQQSGGVNVTSYTVNLTGTVTAGDVTGVYVTDGTSTWSATGSYGNGSSVVCLGANAKPGATLSIKVTLAASAGTKTVAVTLQTDSNAASSLPKGPSNALSILAPVGNDMTSCADCHDFPPADSADAIRNAPVEGEVRGDHQKHLAYTCNFCHVVPATETAADFDHQNGNIQMKNGTIGEADASDNGSYSRGATFAQSNNPTTGTCSATNCHGNNAPQWGVTAAAGAGCTLCHRSGTNDGAAANAYPTTTFRTADAVGLHAYHLTNATVSGLISGGVVCADCHVVPGTVAAAGHMSTLADRADDANPTFPAGSRALLNGYSPSYANATQTCSVYCHDGTSDTNGTDSTPSWNATYGTCSGAANGCHGLPPNPGSGTHAGKAFPGSCNGCHDTVNTSGTIAIVSQHIDGTVQIGGCTGCHGTDPKEYPPLAYWGTNKSTADGVGAHVKHIESTTSLMTKEAIGGESNTTGYWCAECHTTTRGAGGHNDGYPAEVAFTNAVESKYGSTSASFTAEDANPDTGVGGSCTVYCHGANMPNGDTLGSKRTPAWGDTLTGCGTCHGFPPTPSGTHSGITAGTQCGGCHDQTMTNGNATITNTGLHIDGTLQVTVSCTGCHNGSGGGAKNVGPSSAHTDPDGSGGTYSAGAGNCEVCHFDGHSTRTTGTLGVTWDARTMGTDFTLDGKIYLKKLAGTETYEAEICWNCHWGTNMPSINPVVKEFGATQGAYQTGTLNQRNWFGATWSSANFNAYKQGTIQSMHQAKHATGVDPARDTSESAADVANLGCTSCHDVHRLGNNGFTPSGQPYLRGSWTSNPFKEDGAPQTGQTMASDRGAVPRGIDGKAANGIGGWQIEQNNATFTNTTYSGTSGFAGLCAKCHTQSTLEGMTWKGHKGAVSGFTGNTNNDILNETNRGGTSSYQRGYMSYNQVSTYRNSTWVGGLRNNREWSDGIQPRDIQSLQTGTPIGYPAGAVTTISSTGGYQNNFHNFPCSKCHSPHASRLPRLMITNCLDVSHNTWDNDKNPSTWTPGTHVAKQLAYSSTAQNCHRYVSGTDTNKETGQATGTSSGWNTVTPW